jgi:GrpB-like predicted nucleotidyltransferase (UPF0157 family)
MEEHSEKVRRLVSEEVSVVAYDPAWPAAFAAERDELLSLVPPGIITRIEHFGSTAVPGLAAKPIIDMLAEVTDLDTVRQRVAPILEAHGYEYVWRPTMGDDGPPWYAWFIKRDAQTGVRTHHIHMVEADFTEHWDRLLFRDHLIAHPELAAEYGQLKERLAEEHPGDRVAYTQAKTEFVTRVTEAARRERAEGP